MIPVAATVALPAILREPEPAQVTLPDNGPAIVMSAQDAAPVIVTVYAVAFDRELKKTLSAVVGADAPPAPPEEADQFVVVVASHVPVPPTQ